MKVNGDITEIVQKHEMEIMKLSQEIQSIKKELQAIRGSEEPGSKSIIEQTKEAIRVELRK